MNTIYNTLYFDNSQKYPVTMLKIFYIYIIYMSLIIGTIYIDTKISPNKNLINTKYISVLSVSLLYFIIMTIYILYLSLTNKNTKTIPM